jgi:hypothetical protein
MRAPVRALLQQHFPQQALFRPEACIQRHLGGAGLGQDPVDAGGMDAVAAEQHAGGRDDPLLWGTRFEVDCPRNSRLIVHSAQYA